MNEGHEMFLSVVGGMDMAVKKKKSATKNQSIQVSRDKRKLSRRWGGDPQS